MLPGLPAFRQGLDLLLGVGIDRIEPHVESLVSACIEGLCQRGLHVLTPQEPARRAGVIAVQLDGAEALMAFLRRRAVDVYAYPTQRIDPHLFINQDDIARFLAGVDEYLRMRETSTPIRAPRHQG